MTTITLNHTPFIGSAQRALTVVSHWVSQQISAGWATLEMWQERAEQRHRLMEMDDRMLRDIGLSCVDVEREGSKPFWKA